MTVLKNKTQKGFTMISNHVLRDKELSLKDRGVLCTISSLPDGWEFSIAGLSSILPDGVDAIRSSVIKLERLGYMVRTKMRGKDGKYVSEIEVFEKRSTMGDSPSREIRHGETNTEEPPRVNQHGTPVAENPSQYNTDNIRLNIKTEDEKSIYLSEDNNNIAQLDGEIEANNYKKLIADNIKLEWLYEVAQRHGEQEVHMVREIYDVICDMVCHPRGDITIKSKRYSWKTVKEQFMKLRYEHVAGVLNRIVDANLEIKNMSAYLISTLYNESLVGTIETEANLHDDYMKYLRGKPY